MRGAIRTVLLVSRTKPTEMWHACSKTLQNSSSAIEKENLILNPQGQDRSGREKRSGGEMIEEEDKIVGNTGKGNGWKQSSAFSSWRSYALSWSNWKET
jgi:hypothetical protein